MPPSCYGLFHGAEKVPSEAAPLEGTGEKIWDYGETGEKTPN